LVEVFMAPLADTYTAFQGTHALGSGALATVATAVHRALREDPAAVVTVISHDTGRTIDLDLRGSEADVAERYAVPGSPPAATAAGAARVRGRGRPRLGVVAREVTLLPEHWDWLARQPGGASVALRKLVLQAMRGSVGADALRHARERAYAFMSTMAGDLPGFEEATRALFAGDADGLATHIAHWPPDLRQLVARLAQPRLDDATD
jgi:uncharacterized protein